VADLRNEEIADGAAKVQGFQAGPE
jgi:hypothetical protein